MARARVLLRLRPRVGAGNRRALQGLLSPVVALLVRGEAEPCGGQQRGGGPAGTEIVERPDPGGGRAPGQAGMRGRVAAEAWRGQVEPGNLAHTV